MTHCRCNSFFPFNHIKVIFIHNDLVLNLWADKSQYKQFTIWKIGGFMSSSTVIALPQGQNLSQMLFYDCHSLQCLSSKPLYLIFPSFHLLSIGPYQPTFCSICYHFFLLYVLSISIHGVQSLIWVYCLVHVDLYLLELSPVLLYPMCFSLFLKQFFSNSLVSYAYFITGSIHHGWSILARWFSLFYGRDDNQLKLNLI